MLSRFPFLILALIAYNAIAFSGATAWSDVVVSLTMITGGTLVLSAAHMFILASLALLFIELLKATRTGTSSLWDHALSMFVFIACLVEFLMVRQAGTGTFLILTVICLIDVVAGYSITIRAARRDLAMGGERF